MSTFGCIPKEFHYCHYKENSRRHLVRIFLRMKENVLKLMGNMMIVLVITLCWITLATCFHIFVNIEVCVYSYSIYEENFCILYTDLCSWTIILIESATLGAENVNVSQCGVKCGKTAARTTFLVGVRIQFFDANNIPF